MKAMPARDVFAAAPMLPRSRTLIKPTCISDADRQSPTGTNPEACRSVGNSALGRLRSRSTDGSRAILRGMLLVGFFLLITKVLAAAKEILVAARFGVSDIVDAYQFSFALTQWPVAFFGAAIVSTVVPLIIRQETDTQVDDDVVKRFFGYVLVLGCIVGIFVIVGIPAIIRAGFFSFEQAQQDRIISMVIVLGLAVPASLASRFFAGCAIAARTHLNTLFECLPAFMIMAFLFVFTDEEALVFGGFIGLLAQCALLGLSVSRIGRLPPPQFVWPGRAEAEVLRGCGVLVAAHLLLGTVDIVDQFAASTLNSGSIATLGYSNRVLALVLGLVSTTICRSMFPVLTTISETGNPKYMRQVLLWIGCLVIATVVIAIGLAANASEIVELIYERGAFMPAHSERVAAALRWGAWRVPPYVLTMVLVYAITSQRRTRPLIALGCVICISKVAAAAVLTNYFGLNGLIVSSTFVYVLACVFGLWIYAGNALSIAGSRG